MKILFYTPLLDIRYEWLGCFLKVWGEILSRPEWKVELFMPYRTPRHIADIKAVRKAKELKSDYLLMMDDDIWDVPPGALEQLLKSDKDMISTVMYAHGFPYQRCAMVKKDKSRSLIDIAKNKKYTELLEVCELGVQPVDFTAFPFTLFKMDLFDKLSEPWFEHTEEVPTDSYFCQKMLDNGLQPYVDMSIQVNHRGVTCWNRKHRLLADAEFQLATGQLNEDSPVYESCIKFIRDNHK